MTSGKKTLKFIYRLFVHQATSCRGDNAILNDDDDDDDDNDDHDNDDDCMHCNTENH